MTDTMLKIIKQLAPVGLVAARRKKRDERKQEQIAAYWRSQPEVAIASSVDVAVSSIQGLSDEQTRDIAFLENELIPLLGLNNENLQEQPEHLSQFFGKGLHLWQYPKQVAPFLVWLASNAHGIKRYLEIGVRWGGTFILISEFLRRVNPRFEKAIAVDPMAESRLLKHYSKLGRGEYLQAFSTDLIFREVLLKERPEFVFIDGDHSLGAVMHDYDVCSDVCRHIGFHDIDSDSLVETSKFWSFLKRHCSRYDFVEFTDQYPEVNGSFMGIGVLTRKP
jgi:hypothetical protein